MNSEVVTENVQIFSDKASWLYLFRGKNKMLYRAGCGKRLGYPNTKGPNSFSAEILTTRLCLQRDT